MYKYTIPCTPEQTKKALELGAPLEHNTYAENDFIEAPMKKFPTVKTRLVIPTAEEMIGWLEEQIDNIDVIKDTDGTWNYLFYPTNSSKHEIGSKYTSRKEATLAAIDAALACLTNNKK